MSNLNNIDIPNTVENQIILKKPNSSIKIFKGFFKLINIDNEKEKIDITGEVYFQWIPNYGCLFSGNICNSDIKKYLSNPLNTYKVVIEKVEIGNCFITNITTSLDKETSKIKGKFKDKILIGEIQKSIDLISFSIPNLKSISGEVVKKTTASGTTTSHSRIKLETNVWKIIIDKNIEYNKLEQELKNIGGYNILYSGKITRNDKIKFTFEESNEIINCLDQFLSYINGRRLSCLFSTGFNKEIKTWTDYNPRQVETYKEVKNFLFFRNTNSLDLMWKEFNSIWQSERGKDFLTSIIHWYTQSNNQAGLIDGSIIMAQAGLEQLYYWTSSNTNPPNDTPSKFRDLIKYLCLKDSEIPEKFKNLKIFSQSQIENPKHRDIAGVITTIRNNIVHPVEKVKITPQTKHEALQLCLWLIEISLLKILNHQGRYFDRAKAEYVEFDYN